MITIETGRVGSSRVPWEGPARDRRPVLLLFVEDIWDDQQSPVINQTVEPISRWKVGSGCREIDISFYSLLFPSNILGTTTVPVGGATRSRCTCDTLYPISLGTEREYFTPPDLPVICQDSFPLSFESELQPSLRSRRFRVQGLGRQSFFHFRFRVPRYAYKPIYRPVAITRTASLLWMIIAMTRAEKVLVRWRVPPPGTMEHILLGWPKK